MTTGKTIKRERAPAPTVVAAAVKKIAADRASTAPAVETAPADRAKADAAAAAAAAAKPKTKLVRDSFTIPKPEYAVLDALKLRAARLMRPTKKSEVLRAGIMALAAMSDEAFLGAINAVPSLKTGRPKSTPTPAAKVAQPK